MLLFAAALLFFGPGFHIAAGGKAEAVIVAPERASEAETFAVRELKEYLERITGARFEVRAEGGPPVRGFAIHVGRSDRLPREGFVIRTSGRNLFLTGGDDDGVQFAVYEFLEKYGGVRWFWPGAYGEEVPHRATWSLGAIDDHQEPWFHRRTMSLVTRSARGKQTEYEGFGRKWKIGAGVKTAGVHAWGQIVPPAKYGPTHPEYYALVNGTRQRDWTKFDGSHEYQLCTTNPEVIRLSIEWARKYFDEHPDTDILSISPNDGLGFCECDRCRALDTTPGVLSDRMFTYANAVAAGVAATHPKKSLLMLAYTLYREPPKRVKPLPNLVVQYADDADFHPDPARKAERVGDLDRWARLTPHLMIYEYYVWGANLPARGLTPEIAESIQHFRDLGIRLFRTQARGDFGLNGVNYYLAAKLLWNPGLRPEAVLDDYFATAFGPAAPAMKAYFQLLDERWMAAVRQIGARYTPQNALYYLAAYDPAARRRMREFLDRAKTLCASPAQRGRVEFFEKAFRYSELTVEAAEQTVALGHAGILKLETEYPSIFSSPTYILGFTPSADPRPIDRLIAKWEERDRYMTTLEGQAVLDVAAARTYDKYYHFSPLDKLREIRATLGKSGS